MNLIVQDIDNNNIAEVSDLILSLYKQHIKRYYSEEGNEEFVKFVSVPEMNKRVADGNKIMKAFYEEELLGIFEFDKTHLHILFILDDYRGKGYARMIINWIKEFMLENKWGKSLEALVSPNAYKAYDKLGFSSIDGEVIEGGKVMKKMRLSF